MYSAIVLAGGMNKNFNAHGAAEHEALLDIGGKPMISYVLAALMESRLIHDIIIVGPVEKLNKTGIANKVKLVQSGSCLIDNIAEGIKAAATINKVLLCSADIPLLTSEAVDDFIFRCNRAEADLYYPLIDKHVVDAAYGRVNRTYVKLRDGVFTGGNLFFINPLIVPQCMRLAYRVVEKRKQPFALASMLGWRYLLMLAIGRLSSEKAKERAAEILRAKICLIKSEYAEIGMDIDKGEDLVVAQKYLSV